MKKTVITLLAVILAGTSVTVSSMPIFGATVTENDETLTTHQNGREITNDFDPETNQTISYYDITFQVPDAWEEKLAMDEMLAFFPDSDTGSLTVGTFESTRDMGLKENQENFLSSDDEPYSKVEYKTIILFDYVPAVYAVYSNQTTMSDVPAHKYEVAFSVGGRYYLFSCGDDDEGAYDRSYDFDRIIDSISLSAESDKEAVDDFDPYTNQTETFYEISFQVPEEWKDTSSDEEVLTFQAEHGQLVVDSLEGSYSDDPMGKKKNQDDFIAAYETMDSFTLSERYTIPVLDDVSALYFTCSFVLYGEPMDFSFIVFCTEDRFYTLAYGEYDAYDYTQANDFIEIMNSITWASDDEGAISSNDLNDEDNSDLDALEDFNPETNRLVDYYEISFQVPDNWTVAPSGYGTLLYWPEEGQLYIYSEQGLYSPDYIQDQANQNDFMLAFMEQDSYSLKERKMITVSDDIPALYFSNFAIVSDMPMNMYTVVFCSYSRLYAFSYWEDEDSDRDLSNDFDAIINSISLE